MAETMAAFNLVEHLGGQTFEPPFGGFSYGRVRTPHRRPRRTTDGWIVILPYSTQNWHHFWEFGDQSELSDEPRFATAAARIENADELYSLMDEIVNQKSSEDWLDYCETHSIPASEVVELEELRHDPHFDAVGLLREEQHPTEGAYRYVRDPIVFDGQPSPLYRHAPRLGADTAEVLGELGWSAERIKALLAEAPPED